MLIINWKKHYNVPMLFYNETRFTSTRKGKFLFLSDFVFRIIHKYCFKLCLFFYIRYNFFFRFQKLCLNLNKYLSSYSFFTKKQFSSLLSKNFIEVVKKKNDLYIFKLLSFRKKLLLHFNFFLFIFFHSKDVFLKKFNFKYIFFFNIYLKSSSFFFMSYFFSKIWSLFFNILFFFKKNNTFFFYSNNILFLLYQLKQLRFFIRNVAIYFYSLISLSSIYKNYLKNMSYNIKNISFDFNKKYNILFEHLKIKNIFYFPMNWKKNYVIYFNFFINQFHKLLYYFFQLKKISTSKYLKYLNYINLNILVSKKDLFYRFKNQFIVFKRKLRRYRRRFMWKFYKFLVRLLYVKKNWLLGPVHKIKFFKYLFVMYKKLKKTFKKLFFFNSPYSKKKKSFSFFFNSTKIREHFFIFLGKKRYSEEFLLLKNKKWYFKFYIKQFYNVDFKFILHFYLLIRKKFNIKLIKELFSFLEYNIQIFLKKYVFFFFSPFYNLSSLTKNSYAINAENTNMFFIGDMIKINLKDLNLKFFYEKFFIFFNVIFYINPFFFDRKHIFIKNLYSKIYSYLNHKFDHYISIFSEKKKTFFIQSFKRNRMISFFTKTLGDFNINFKISMKSLFFFLEKFNFFIFQKTNEFHSIFNLNGGSLLLNFYSYNKTYNKFSLVHFYYMRKWSDKKIKKSFFKFKKIRKNLIFRRFGSRKWIKKRINYNLYNLIKYNNIPSSNKTKEFVYGNLLYKKLNQSNFRFLSNKKLFFLGKKNNFFNIVYPLNKFI